jgi:putative FmdB family regulatory protein
MPLYSYECRKCHKVVDKVFPINDCPRTVECDKCRHPADKILSIGHGGIQTDGDVKWLPSACEVLQRHGERPLETRTEYRNYLKDNGLVAGG